ncbi:MAG TPA: hypothetical protein VL096_04380, partial [Pirellulaceae bacterium]|nr:hypothetical protein [Pirellulaceae bacterium]
MPATQPAIIYHGSDRDFATELAALAAPGSWQWHSPSNESPSACPAQMQLRIIDLDDLSGGIEITQRLKNDAPGVPVIVVSRDATPAL